MLTKSDIEQLKTVLATKDDISSLEAKLKPITKDIQYLRKKTNRIDKTVSLVAKNYDEGDVRLERRVRKIEQHLSL